MEVPYIQIDLDRSENDSRYFVDYCHPIHEPNQLIADEIAAIVSGKSSGKEHFLKEQHDSIVPTEESRFMLECPTEHYTLY